MVLCLSRPCSFSHPAASVQPGGSSGQGQRAEVFSLVCHHLKSSPGSCWLIISLPAGFSKQTPHRLYLGVFQRPSQALLRKSNALTPWALLSSCPPFSSHIATPGGYFTSEKALEHGAPWNCLRSGYLTQILSTWSTRTSRSLMPPNRGSPPPPSPCPRYFQLSSH